MSRFLVKPVLCQRLWHCSSSAALRRRFSTTACILSSKPARKLFKTINVDIDKESDVFKDNVAFNMKLQEKYKSAMEIATAGGGPKAIDRHVNKNKKLLATERLKRILDEESEFLELSAFAGLDMEYGTIPEAGIITGIGKVHGIHCMLIVNDATVKGGTVYPIGVTKQLRAQEIALQNRLPTVYIVDSGGAFLPLQADIFPDKEHGGRTFRNEAILNSEDIPQLAVVVGQCTAGGAYVPTMSQEALIVHRIGNVFLGGPPLVYAALKEIVSSEDLGGATLHCKVSGCTDHFAENEDVAYETSRDIIATFNIPEGEEKSGFDEPIYDVKDLAGVIPRKDQHTMDMYQVISRITDGSRFQEFKAQYGPTLVTGFAHICGNLIGIVGNNGAMTARAATKGAHFVQMCSQRRIPLVFLQNTEPETQLDMSLTQGDEIGSHIRARAQLMSAIACAEVPKITVITGNSYGLGNYMMCGRSFSPRFLFSWPNSRMAIMEPDELKEACIKDQFPDGYDVESEQFQKFQSKVLEKVEKSTYSMYGSSRMWDDGIILPQDTRKVIGHCLQIIDQSPQPTEHKHAVMRM